MAESPFADGPLDEIDQGILHLLQGDARNMTLGKVAEQLPVSEGTVRNRIGKMEESGIVQGYIPLIDYEAAGAPLRMLFTCTAPIDRRSDLVEAALSIDGVINVREFTASHGNVRVVAIASVTDDISRISRDLTDIGLTVENETLMRQELTQPMNRAGAADADDT